MPRCHRVTHRAGCQKATTELSLQNSQSLSHLHYPMDTRQLTSGEADGVSDGSMTLQALGGVNSPCGWYRVRGQLPSTRGREHTHTPPSPAYNSDNELGAKQFSLDHSQVESCWQIPPQIVDDPRPRTWQACAHPHHMDIRHDPDCIDGLWAMEICWPYPLPSKVSNYLYHSKPIHICESFSNQLLVSSSLGNRTVAGSNRSHISSASFGIQII